MGTRRIASCGVRGGVVIALALAWAALACSESTREETPPPAQPAAPAAQVDAVAESPAVSSGEVRALVSPVALFPDPLLALVLQASTQPLEVVAADRFLSLRAQDPSAAPDSEWDPSVVGLLNYPDLITMLNGSLDWTESLGSAVLDELGVVQRSVQEIRWSAYNLGILRSNEAQRVLVRESVIAIVPAQPDRISIPSYDGAALLEAIESGTVTQAATVQTAVPEPSRPEAPPATVTATETAPATSPVASPVPAPAAYAVPVTYSEPQSSFWTNAAIFTGGAVVGGLLGYAIGDDDDDDDDHHRHHYGWGGGYGGGYGGRHFKADDIRIEGNTVVINNPGRIQDQLRKRARVETYGAGRPGRGVATRPGRPGKLPPRAVKLPRPAGRPKAVAAVRPAARPPTARPALPKAVAKPGAVRRDQRGGLGDRASPPKVARERDRGARSRDVAAARRHVRPAAGRDAAVSRERQEGRGGGIAGQHRGGAKVRKDAERGAKSRAGGKGRKR